MTTDSVYQLTASFFQDPHSTYRLLNERGPVHHVEFPNGMRVWLVTDYALAKRVLTDPTISKDLYGPVGEIAQTNGNAVMRLDPPVNNHMVYSDPPRHTRLRKIAMEVLSGRVVRDVAPRVAQIAQQLLDAMADEESVDLVEAYAYPFAVTVICELIGIAASDRTEFQGWLITQQSTADPAEKYAAAAKFKAYVARLVEERSANGRTDFVSELIAATDEGGRLDQVELVAMINALLLGSQETIAGLIGHAVLLMLRQRHLLTELVGDPDLIPAFIEETLRYEASSNLSTYRFTTVPIELGGRKIDSGQIVLASLSGANRDPKVFDRPDEVDPHRLDNRHIAFGYGMHFCAGATLARKEAHIAISSLLARYPEISFATAVEDLRWNPSYFTRGLESLPIRLGRSTSAPVPAEG
ncbi:cytochrome P450 [Nocardia sp. NPDC051463]|uniref:cytochrome P450 family protein n=1 Tax=Nocardia sp. NPDC051463 TaxID=3154845 RepID=UPI00341CC35C